MNLLADALETITWLGTLVLAAALVLDVLIVVAGGRALILAARRRAATEDDAAMASPLTPPSSILIARSGSSLVDRVRSLLDLRYPELEVIVVDAAHDRTIERLGEAFDLVEIPVVVPALVPTKARVTSSAVARDGMRLVVIEVDGQPSYADLLNVGVNVARARLLCALRPGLTLADDALLRLARPFMDDPRHAVAAVAIARPLNGCSVRRGRVVATGWPTTLLARLRLVDQLVNAVLSQAVRPRTRSQADAGGMLLLRRDHVVELGGFRPRAGGENADLLRRIGSRARPANAARRIVAVPNPICWRQVRGTRAGTAEAYRTAGYASACVLAETADPRSQLGRLRRLRVWLRTGIFLVPAVQLVTGVVALVGLVLGDVDAGLVVLWATAAFLAPATVSVAALAIEELAFPREGALRNLAAMIAAAALAPLGYRQLAEWWRLRGLLAEVPPAPSAPVATVELDGDRPDPVRPPVASRRPRIRRRRPAGRGPRERSGR